MIEWWFTLLESLLTATLLYQGLIKSQYRTARIIGTYSILKALRYRVPYDAVNSGTVSIKIDRIVPGARDYYVVKVSEDKGLQDA